MASSSDEFIRICYDELRKEAEKLFRKEKFGHTLQPTALVNEVYIRLCKSSYSYTALGREKYLLIATQAMRNLLVDHARKANAEKRGGKIGKPESLPTLCPLGDVNSKSRSDFIEVLALNEALDKLEKLKKQHAEIIMLRTFSGLTIAETATILNVSDTTVEKGWRMGRAWLKRELSRQ